MEETRPGQELVAQLAAEAAAEVERLAREAGAALAGGEGMERAELAIRAVVTELGRAVLASAVADGILFEQAGVPARDPGAGTALVIADEQRCRGYPTYVAAEAPRWGAITQLDPACAEDELRAAGGPSYRSLLAADAGYIGPQADCGAGHQAAFAGYRARTTDTVLGRVTIRRAWYHCAGCGHGLAPRDEQLGVAGQTMWPGLRKMTARAAAAVPFAAAARLVGKLAGITVTGNRAGDDRGGGVPNSRCNRRDRALSRRHR